MTTFLTLGLLSGKCSYGNRIRIWIHHHGCGSADPDTNQNDMDPKHCYKSCHLSHSLKISAYFLFSVNLGIYPCIFKSSPLSYFL